MTLPAWTGLLIAGLVCFPAISSAIAWQRLRILEGDVWQLLTGHFVHWDTRHAVLNATGAVLLGLYFKHLSSRFWCFTALGALIGCNAGLMLESTPLEEYRGFSAALYGWLITALLQPTPDGEKSKVQWTIAVLLLVWVLFEATGLTAVRQLTETIPVHAAAHAYGVLGALLGMILKASFKR